MMMSRLPDGHGARTEKNANENQQQDALFSTTDSSSAASRPPLPRVSPTSFTSHAMMLQIQEYRTRVQSAFQSTYCHPLAITTSRNGPESPRKRKGNYCRSRVLESSRRLFSAQARSGAPATPVVPSSPPRTSSKGGGVAFHRSTTSPRTNVQSSLYAPGPGQYDIIPRRPATTGSVKFSPADRFPEHAGGGNIDPQLGPGQYTPNDRATARRSARVVFSQLPRNTVTAESPRGTVSAPPATEGIVSSYYYVPESAFVSPGDMVASAGGGIPSWSHAPRFPGRREHFHQNVKQTSPAVDYIARNKAKIESMSTEHRQRRRMEQEAKKKEPVEIEERRPTSFRRRNSLLELNALDQRQSIMPHGRSSCSGPVDAGNIVAIEKENVTIPQAWSTLIVLSFTQTRLERLLTIASVLRRLRLAQELRYKSVVFQAWTRVRDRVQMRTLAAALIARNTFRYRLNLRVERRVKGAILLRKFLSGLSVDVRFAMSVRRIKRRIIQLQRWWRRARLVVRAREQCLAYKWLVIEQRLRIAHITQMPHLHKIFQPSPTAAPLLPASTSGGSMRGRKTSIIASPATVEAQTPLYKLLNLPDQKRWFNARFVLTADGVLRGFGIPALNAGPNGSESASDDNLVVEVKHFRCHAHGFLNIALGSTHTSNADDDGESDWRPYLMVFKPGASRFILITDIRSLVLAPLLDWKDKLERLAGHSLGSPFTGGGSTRDIADILTKTDVSVLDEVAEEFLISPSRRNSMSISAGSTLIQQGRRRSSRAQLRRSQAAQPIAEGELCYYVVDLLKDCPRIPPPVVWVAIRDKLREERKNFRAEIYRYKLETERYKKHERERRQVLVQDKFKEFFAMERPSHPHFRSLIPHRKMEVLVRQTIELVKSTQPSNPRLLLPSLI